MVEKESTIGKRGPNRLLWNVEEGLWWLFSRSTTMQRTTGNVHRSKKLPDEILEHIFSFLEYTDVIACSQVNTRWNRLCGNKVWKIIYKNNEKTIDNFRCDMALLDEKDIRELEGITPSFWKENFRDALNESKNPWVIPVQWQGITFINRIRGVAVSKTPTLGGNKNIPLVCLRHDEEGWLFTGNHTGVPILQHPKAKQWFDTPPKCPLCHQFDLNVIFTSGTVGSYSLIVELELKCTHCNRFLTAKYYDTE